MHLAAIQPGGSTPLPPDRRRACSVETVLTALNRHTEGHIWIGLAGHEGAISDERRGTKSVICRLSAPRCWRPPLMRGLRGSRTPRHRPRSERPRTDAPRGSVGDPKTRTGRLAPIPRSGDARATLAACRLQLTGHLTRQSDMLQRFRAPLLGEAGLRQLLTNGGLAFERWLPRLGWFVARAAG